MLDVIKILFFVVAGIFLASILNDAPSARELGGGGGGTTPRGEYVRSYDRNGDGVISDDEYRAGETARIAEEIEDLEEEVAEAILEENRSPHAAYVSLRSGNLHTEDEDAEYVVIYASDRLPNPIRITGWRLESLVSKRGASIPRGTSILTPSRSNRVIRDIMLAPGEGAVVITGNGDDINVSFLTNACTGYLNEEFEFVPTLDTQCPLLEDEDLAAFRITPSAFQDDDDYIECIDAIENVPSCGPAQGYVGIPNRCREFIHDYATYEGCFELHENDADFLSNEWRVFLGSRIDLWRSDREAVVLVDENGLLVDIIR